jgi:hypothetical protein
MNRLQKLAWFNLIVITATIIITALAITIEIRIRGYSTIGFWVFVALLSSLKLKPYLFKKSRNKVLSDERDNLIQKRALSFAYTLFWIVLVVSSFAIFISTGMGPKSSVPAITLPLMVIGGALFMKIVCSVAILVQYGWTGKGEQS